MGKLYNRQINDTTNISPDNSMNKNQDRHLEFSMPEVQVLPCKHWSRDRSGHSIASHVDDFVTSCLGLLGSMMWHGVVCLGLDCFVFGFSVEWCDITWYDMIWCHIMKKIFRWNYMIRNFEVWYDVVWSGAMNTHMTAPIWAIQFRVLSTVGHVPRQ
jgi:hypothetical protein